MHVPPWQQLRKRRISALALIPVIGYMFHNARGIMARVLLVGYVRELLEERDHVLRAAGHLPTMALNQQTAFQSIEESTYDVAVLGFGVPEQERNEMALRLTQANAGIRIVMIYFDSIKNTELADALIPTTAGAQDVLRAVNHVLKTEKVSKSECPAEGFTSDFDVWPRLR